MRLRTVVVAGLFGVMLAACGGTDEEGTATGTSAEGLIAEAERTSTDIRADGSFIFGFTSWQQLPSDDNVTERDLIVVTGLRIEEDELLVDVQHGGGCRQHDYGVSWNGAFKESEPVQVSLVVTHDSNQDLCYALLRSTLRVPLQPLRDAWRAAYRQEHGSMLLGIDGGEAEVVDTF